MSKANFKKYMYLLLVFLVLLAVDPFWKRDLESIIDKNNSQNIVFIVDESDTGSTIAAKLHEAGLIKKERSFLRGIKSQNLDTKLQIGSFDLQKSMSMQEIMNTLSKKGGGELKITIPESWAISEIDAHLTNLNLISSGDFKKCALECNLESRSINISELRKANSYSALEGYFFPDTYFENTASFNLNNFTQKLISNFDEKWLKLSSENQTLQVLGKNRSMQELIIVASMLEEEAMHSKDFPLVAGIIWKRLDADWQLGIDATLLYEKSSRTISSSDLASDSLYNTRKNTGLPPTAIGNPGLHALESALNPKESDYWFYINDQKTGKAIYAKTLDEHNKNINQYLK